VSKTWAYPKKVFYLARIGIQVLDGLAALHSVSVVHRDIKPDNIVLDFDKNDLHEIPEDKAYLVDFGIATYWYHARDTQHKDSSGFRGLRSEPTPTPTKAAGSQRYASVNAHHKQRAQRFDDVESLGYTLLALLAYGFGQELPWVQETNRRETGSRLSKDEIWGIYAAVKLGLTQKEPRAGDKSNLVPEWVRPHLLRYFVHVHDKSEAERAGMKCAHIPFGLQPDYELLRQSLINLREDAAKQMNQDPDKSSSFSLMRFMGHAA